MQIWSGVIGAGVTAAVSIYVAILVVGRTNAHQSALAEKSLEVQRAGMQEQLDLQRKESARLRMMEIRADVISAASHMVEAARRGSDAIGEAALLFDRAVTRWRIEAIDDRLTDELQHWPSFLRILALQHSTVVRRGDPAARNVSFAKLNDAVSMLSVVALRLPRDTSVAPPDLARLLRDARVGDFPGAPASHSEPASR